MKRRAVGSPITPSFIKQMEAVRRGIRNQCCQHGKVPRRKGSAQAECIGVKPENGRSRLIIMVLKVCVVAGSAVGAVSFENNSLAERTSVSDKACRGNNRSAP
jgi:hypothetical protein